MKHSLFPDEFLAFKRKELSLEQDFKQAGKEVGEALKQSSETSHDNAPLDAAKLSGELASKKIREVQDILANSQVVRIVSDESIVSMGKTIVLSVDGNEVIYTIGGYQTPIKGRVSYNAPLIKALLGKEEGEIIKINLNGKAVEIEILKINQGLTF